MVWENDVGNSVELSASSSKDVGIIVQNEADELGLLDGIALNDGIWDGAADGSMHRTSSSS